MDKKPLPTNIKNLPLKDLKALLIDLREHPQAYEATQKEIDDLINEIIAEIQAIEKEELNKRQDPKAEPEPPAPDFKP